MPDARHAQLASLQLEAAALTVELHEHLDRIQRAPGDPAAHHQAADLLQRLAACMRQTGDALEALLARN